MGGTATDASALMTDHRLLSSAMRSNDDIDWLGNSLRFSFQHLRGLPLRRLSFTVDCSLWYDGLRQRIMTTDKAEP